MRNKILKLKEAYDDDYIDTLVSESRQPSDADYDVIIDEPCTVLKPDGEVLLKLLPGILPNTLLQPAWDAFHNRLARSHRPAIEESANPGTDGILGFMDRGYPIDYCRMTALTNHQLAGYQSSIPLIQAVGTLFKQQMPSRWQAQMEFCGNVNPMFVIPGSPFTSVTINRDATARYHTDKGDLVKGFGVIAAVWAGWDGKDWTIVPDNPGTGGLLAFPKFRIAVRLATGSLLFCDVHEAHGVTPISGEPGSWARMSFVFYCRSGMNLCGTPEEEIRLANLGETSRVFPRYATPDDNPDEDSDVT